MDAPGFEDEKKASLCLASLQLASAREYQLRKKWFLLKNFTVQIFVTYLSNLNR